MCLFIWVMWSAWHHTTKIDDVPNGALETRGIDMRININDANAAELSLLPGIGEQLALRIIDDRERNGPFESISDLTRVRGIGVATADRITPYAVAEPPG